MPINRYNVTTLKKLAKLPHKTRKKHLDNWDLSAYKDIKNICSKACSNPKIPKKCVNKLKKQKKTIRKIALANPSAVKKILVSQKGSGIFTALAAGIIPAIIGAIVKKRK